jgi:hypothetical protein
MEKDMIEQLNNAFADLDQRMQTAAIDFAKEKKEGYSTARAEKEAQIKEWIAEGKMNPSYRYSAMFHWSVDYFGSRGLMDTILYYSWANAVKRIIKNTQSKIDRRNAQIIKALEKKGVSEIPEFDLVEYSDGLEGYFEVAGNKITIRTILAGGYNIQCLHARTLVKIK